MREMSGLICTSVLSCVLMLTTAGVSDAITLVADGTPRAVIVTADEPSETVERAVDELNYWIERITGTTLPVVEHGDWDGEGTPVAVGDSPFTEARDLDVSDLGPEGALVQATDDYVALLGRDEAPVETVSWRGTYYAVMELVGKAFGVRVIWPGELGEVYPTAATLEVPEGSWTWETSLVVQRSLRNSHAERLLGSRQEKVSEIGMEIDPDEWKQIGSLTDQWLQRQRMNRPSHISFGHSFTSWWDRYSEEHPEWFALRPDGARPSTGGRGTKLCVSNPELREAIFDEWYEQWQENPEANNVLRACPNDSRGFCTCDECRAWDPPEMAEMTPAEIHTSPEARLSDRYARFWSELAERVTSVDPDARVTGYAYRSYQKPPMYAGVHPAVLLGYVGGEGFYPHEDHIRPEWEQWAEAGASLQWRPNLLHCGHGAPYVFARALGEDFKYLHDHNMVGTDFDSLGGAWATQGLNFYVLAELHSRPEADVEEIVQEFYAAFGPASDEVGAYFDYWEQVTEDGPDLLMELAGGSHRRTWGQWFPGFIGLVPYLYTSEVLDAGEALLERAEAAVADADEREIARVEFLRIGLDHTRLMATALREMELLKAGDPAGDENALQVAAETLRAFREQHADSVAIPTMSLTARELTYKQTRPLWIRE
jgi:hypothetical protein